MTFFDKIKRVIKNILFKDDPLKEFKADFYSFTALDKTKRFNCTWENIYPCLHDNSPVTPFDAHYVYHPAWAARIIQKINPKKHLDISSTLHFSSIISAFIPVDFYDYRPAKLNLNNLQSKRCDLNKLAFNDNSINSLSCMHTIEHIGLGRYGDAIDPDGDLNAISELKRVCSVGGNLLIVVPVGEQKIAFNAHRIYNPHHFLSYFSGFKLQEFALVTDDQQFINNAELDLGANQKYGCGCFWFIKENANH